MPGTGHKVVYIISFFHVLLARETFLIRIHALAPQGDIVWLKTVDYMSEKGGHRFCFCIFVWYI